MPCRRAVLGLGAVALGAGARGKRVGAAARTCQACCATRRRATSISRTRRQTGLPRRHPHLAGLAGPRPGLRLARFPRAPGADRREFHPHVGDRRRGRPQRARPDPPSPLRQDRRRPLRSRQVRRCLLRPDTRARDRAGQRGMYVSQMLFNGWGLQFGEPRNPFLASPWKAGNNVNGINGDPRNTGIGRDVQTLNNPAITAIQENYVRRVVDALDDLPNMLFRSATRPRAPRKSWAWQHHMLAVVKRHDALRGGFRHPVGLTAAAAWIGDEAGINDRLAGSDADSFSPTGSTYQSDPPPASGARSASWTPITSGASAGRAWTGCGGPSPRPQPALHGLAPRPGPRRALRAVRRRQPARANSSSRGGGAGRHPADPRRFRDGRPSRDEKPRGASSTRYVLADPADAISSSTRRKAAPSRSTCPGRRREPAQGWVGGRGGRHGGRERCGRGRQRRAIRASLRGKARRPGAAPGEAGTTTRASTAGMSTAPSIPRRLRRCAA